MSETTSTAIETNESVFGSMLDPLMAELPARLADHLLITVIPLTVGVAMSLPLAILLVRRPALRYPVLAAVSVLQTIPSLALLALMVWFLVSLGSLVSPLGIEISALGFWPTVIALTAYSILPILRNTVTGILGVPAAMVEAARGLGMTSRQVLWKVEFPLAIPVIIAGVRTATVWVVGTATLATPVGQRCLGNYIFQGLQTRTWSSVLFGCVAAAVLAVVLDTLIGLIQSGTEQRKRTRLWLASIALLVIVLGGLLAPTLLQWRSQGFSSESDRPAIIIGGKTFTEQYILAELVQMQLAEQDISVQKTESLGSTIVFDALVSRDLDVYVDYSGTVWANYMKRTETADSETVLREVSRWLERTHGLVSLGSLGFENAYGLAVRREDAERLGLKSIGDLARVADSMTIGGDYEFFQRPEWEAIRQAYSLNFGEQTSYDSTFMYEAIRADEVEVIAAFTTDGRIAAYDLVVLDDPWGAIPPYDAILIITREAIDRPGVREALLPLIGTIDVQQMREANLMVDREQDKRTPREAARFIQKNLRDGSVQVE